MQPKMVCVEELGAEEDVTDKGTFAALASNSAMTRMVVTRDFES